MAPDTRSTRSVITAVGLALSLASLGQAGERVPDLITDQPDQTESSETVAPGYVQFEFGWTHAEDDEGMDIATDSFPQTLIRLGVVDGIELRVGFDGYIWEDIDGIGREGDAGDLEVGLKWKFWDENGRLPQTAILISTSGQNPFSNKRFDSSARLACSHTLTPTIGLGYNVGGNWASNVDNAGDRDMDVSAVYSVVLGFAHSDALGTFVEFFGEAPTDEGKPANSLDAGITYLIDDNLQLDVLGGVGLSEAADDWFIGAGLVWRLPR